MLRTLLQPLKPCINHRAEERFGEQNHKLAGKYAIENILPELKDLFRPGSEWG